MANSARRAGGLTKPLAVTFALVAVLASVFAACGGGDSQGTGEVLDDAQIESQIAAGLERELDREHEVNCPEDGIEAGTDFSCVAEPAGLDASVRIDATLDEAGENLTIHPIDPDSAGY